MSKVIMYLLSAMFLFVFNEQASAQNPFSVKGRVIDQAGEAIIGASIMEKGTTNATITDTDGLFELRVSGSDHVLKISYIGYQSKEVKPSADMRVTLVEESKSLDEVVVVGYQTMRKTDLTGAVASVKGQELNLTTPTVGQSLVGKVSGVQISQVSGAPYESTKIRVRGTASINASSDPLYVIDGYPMTGNVWIDPESIESIEVLKDAASAAIYGSRAAGGVVIITTKRGKEGKPTVSYNLQCSMNQLAKKVKLLNSEQFLDLLVEARNNAYKNVMVTAGKDWDDSYFQDNNTVRSQRIGSSNSAVMIPDFAYDFDTQQIKTPEYDTDWQDELYRNAFAQRHHLSISGGNDNVKYEVNGSFQDQDGIIVSTDQKKINLMSNIDIALSKKFKISTNMSTINLWSNEIQEGRFNQGPVLGALIYAPVFACYNEDGSLKKGEMTSYSSAYGLQQIENPVALAEETVIKRTTNKNTFNVVASYEPVRNLFLKANLGMYTYNQKYEFYRPTSLSYNAYQPYSDQAKAAANAISRNTNQKDYLAELTSSYSKTWNNIHNFSGVVGYSIEQNKKDVLGVKATGFEDDHITEVTGHGADASNLVLNSTSKSNWSMISYFSRLNYNYDRRYYITASFRGDASSLFGPDNRWGYFPSVSLAWSLNNEGFYKDAFGDSSSLKLRASWGKSGNNNIGNYNYESTMSSPTGAVFGSGTVVSAMYPTGVTDSSIGWETTSQYNFGADWSMFNNRLSISANYYISYTKDLLFEQPISAITGTTSYLTNLDNSKIRNTGVDIQVDGRILSHKDYNLSVSGNISVNRNKVLELGENNTIITNGAERSYKTHITTEGQPIGMFYGFKVKGMVTEADMVNIAEDNKYYDASTKSFPEGYVLKGPARSLAQTTPLQAGDLYFEDVDGNGVVDDNDKGIIGSPHPDFTYGFNISGNYKNIDLQASFNGSYGNKVLDGQDYYLFNMEASGNQYVEADQRYRNSTNTGNGWVYKCSRGGTQSNSTRLSTFYLQDGSFLRCTNLTLGYTLPSIQKITKGLVKHLRLYAAADNLFTITKYRGYNPEVDYNNGSNLTPGVDYGKYPLVRSYNFGIQATF